MELRHLKYFVTVTEELNFSRASARLRVSQPAVSRQIKDLEDEIGAPLFVRNPTGLKLTPAGETLLAHARDILRRSADSVKAMQAFGKPAPQAITLGYIPTALPSFLTDALREFSNRYPKVAVHLREISPQEQIMALREDKIDLAFIGSPCSELKRECDLTIVKRIPLSVALPDNHLLARRKTIELKELRDDDFVGLRENRFPGRNDFICKTCQTAGFTPRITAKADSLSSMLALVAAGKGVALLPSEVENLPHARAVFIPLKRCRASIEWAVASRKAETNKLIGSLLDILKTQH
jgi:LysR family transcriptional regulator, benzoate and cis,cis-muconate-responsive activator of ben and cat genes